MMMLILCLGVLAGALTTVAGLGGGMLLLLALSLLGSPAEALALTSPALLLGNLHRLILHRREIDLRIAGAVALGALPGSLLGGALVPSIPPAALRALLVAATTVAVARTIARRRDRKENLPASPPPCEPSSRNPRPPFWRATLALAPAGLGIGAAAATSGGAGLLMGPLLLSAGLTGGAYIATGAAAAVSMHLGRILAYGAGGLITVDLLAPAAMLTAAIMAGNLLGERARQRLNADLGARIEIGVLCACVALALGGAA